MNKLLDRGDWHSNISGFWDMTDQAGSRVVDNEEKNHVVSRIAQTAVQMRYQAQYTCMDTTGMLMRPAVAYIQTHTHTHYVTDNQVGWL